MHWMKSNSNDLYWMSGYEIEYYTNEWKFDHISNVHVTNIT